MLFWHLHALSSIESCECESVTVFGGTCLTHFSPHLCLFLTVSVVFQQALNGLPTATLGRLKSKCYEEEDFSRWWDMTCPPFLSFLQLKEGGRRICGWTGTLDWTLIKYYFYHKYMIHSNSQTFFQWQMPCCNYTLFGPALWHWSLLEATCDDSECFYWSWW